MYDEDRDTRNPHDEALNARVRRENAEGVCICAPGQVHTRCPADHETEVTDAARLARAWVAIGHGNGHRHGSLVVGHANMAQVRPSWAPWVGADR